MILFIGFFRITKMTYVILMVQILISKTITKMTYVILVMQNSLQSFEK